MSHDVEILEVLAETTGEVCFFCCLCLSIFCGSSPTLISLLVAAKDSEGDFLLADFANQSGPNAATTFNPSLPIMRDDASKSLLRLMPDLSFNVDYIARRRTER